MDDVLTVSPANEADRLSFTLRNPSAVDLVTVAHLAQEIERLNAEYDTAPSASLLAAAVQCHSQVTLLYECAPAGRIRRALAFSVAESATLMGQLIWDAFQRRDDVVPLRYFDQAISAAREISDPLLEAHANCGRASSRSTGPKTRAKGSDSAARQRSSASPQAMS